MRLRSLRAEIEDDPRRLRQLRVDLLLDAVEKSPVRERVHIRSDVHHQEVAIPSKQRDGADPDRGAFRRKTRVMGSESSASIAPIACADCWEVCASRTFGIARTSAPSQSTSRSMSRGLWNFTSDQTLQSLTRESVRKATEDACPLAAAQSKTQANHWAIFRRGSPPRDQASKPWRAA